jgi:putative protease
MSKSPVELLLPVGDMEMCLAAIHNGADAIYVGVPEFNARGRTKDHSFEELKEMIELCHLYGVKVNLAFNVVVFEDELKQAAEVLKKVIALSPDAIIVQDLGIASLIRQMSPNINIHASTQMTVTNSDAIALLADLNIKRFVLGRENSLKEIRLIKEETNKELEVFVHGALCVAYSGQCFTSESIGGRSANRGPCAQSCRFEYDLFVDDKKKDLVGRDYLVSPKDLCAIEHVPELMKIGVESFKVEGRLKSPSYVAGAAKNYRLAIDGKNYNKSDMAYTFSRGFFDGWMQGVDHQQLVDGYYSAHRGQKMGVVVKVLSDGLLVSGQGAQNGMGVLIVNDRVKRSFGANLYEVIAQGENSLLKFSRQLDFRRCQIGDDVYINSAPMIEKELLKAQKKIFIKLKIFAKANEKLKIEASDLAGNVLTIWSEEIMPAAQKIESSLSELRLKEELSALFHTPFQTSEVIVEMHSAIFCPDKILRGLRRKYVEGLMEARKYRQAPEIKEINWPINNEPKMAQKTAELNILLRNANQVKAFAEYFAQLNSLEKNCIAKVTLDFEFGRDYNASVEIIKSLGIKTGVATTRILKPREYYNFKLLLNAKPDFILVRNLGAIEYFRTHASSLELAGDFSLNAANGQTAEYLLQKGLSSITPSYDLNIERLLLMARASQGLEVTLYQYMPSFHMEHCVFAAFLSKGSSFADCGKPCEKHQVSLKDQFGNHHFIKADQECRNTMFNGQAQSGAKYFKEMQEVGISQFRFEALNENALELTKKIQAHLDLFLEKISNVEFFKLVNASEKYGLGDLVLGKVDDYRPVKQVKKSTYPNPFSTPKM